MSADHTVTSAAEQDSYTRLHKHFNEIWTSPPGIGQLSAVNHSAIGHRFIVTGFIFLLLGGLLAMFMRAQLAWPGNTVLDHDTYNQFFTMHGTTMMFLFAVPILEGFAVYLIPKMIGARDLPFPRLTAFGYWCYLFGGTLLYSSFLVGAAPSDGWFMYVPLSSQFSPGMNADFWLLGVTFVEISAVAASVELIVAILKNRAPGMSINRMPLFAWYILVTAFMIAFGFPPLILGSILLEIERAFDFAFYDVTRGGDPLLWQHLFWLFGHPEVYIILLPAVGMIAMIVPVFARRPMAGYSWVVLAVIGIGFISFGLWVHHMFTVGIPLLALSFFSAASMAVAIPTGMQIFAFIATLWRGQPVVRVPLLFILGFFFIFVLGGLTGVMVALVPFNWQVHDTHFVVAHLHYVTIGGMMFPLFAGVYYWLPHFSGRLSSEPLGRMTFWLIFIGFNVTFLPMHWTGLLGMPRRVYTYEEGLGWEWLNLTSTVGGFILSVGILALIIDCILHFRYGKRAERNPWKADSLEWSIRSPVPPYNFISIPPVESRNPLWEQDYLVRDMERGAFFLSNPRSGQRETLGTSIRDAQPEQVIRLSKSTWIPLITALTTALFFVGFLIKVYAVAALGVVLTVIAFLVWLWTTGDRFAPDKIDAGGGLVLPMQAASPQAPGWWGLVIALLADASLFASLVFGYFFLWNTAAVWPPSGYGLEGLELPLLGAGVLLASSAAMQWAATGNRQGRLVRFHTGLLIALLLGLVFIAIQVMVFLEYPVSPQQHAYASIVYTLAGFHLVHVVIALLMNGFIQARSWYDYVSEYRPLEARITATFWHYMVGQGLVGFGVIHLFPLIA